MAGDAIEVLLIGAAKPQIVDGLKAAFKLHVLTEAADKEAMIAEVAPRVRGIAVSGPPGSARAALMARMPKLELVSSFGVGYDNIDADYAAQHGITVTHTPEVLNEEVADTTLGLLLCTVREFPQSDRYVRSGQWETKPFPLSPGTLRDRTVGIVGLGRIGMAIAKRLDAFGVPVVYHTRRPRPEVGYRHYPKLVDMARDVDTLIVITPGGAETKNLINAEVLAALGPRGVLINMARGSVVDESALIQALQDRTIFSAGLDVYVDEPKVPKALMEMDHVVLFPHVGSASVWTRQKMEQLVVDNLTHWAAGKPPLTPVPETPWPPKR